MIKIRKTKSTKIQTYSWEMKQKYRLRNNGILETILLFNLKSLYHNYLKEIIQTMAAEISNVTFSSRNLINESNPGFRAFRGNT
jgi:hypothetical protein